MFTSDPHFFQIKAVYSCSIQKTDRADIPVSESLERQGDGDEKTDKLLQEYGITHAAVRIGEYSLATGLCRKMQPAAVCAGTTLHYPLANAAGA